MFMHESLCARGTDHGVLYNGRPAKRLDLGEVRLTAQGMRMLGEGMLAVSAQYGLPLPMLKDAMKGALYLVPPSSSLYFLFQVPELEADMHIEIPAEFWRFNQPDFGAYPEERCA